MSTIPPESEPQGGFGELFYEAILPKIERISLLVILGGLLLWMIGIKKHQEILILGLGTSLLTYFLYAFEPPRSGLGTVVNLTVKFMYLGSAIAALGILYWLSRWSGAKLMLFIGSISLIVGTVIILIRIVLGVSESDRNTMRTLLLRTFIPTLISTYLFFFYLNPQLWH
jgi:hypothetical protein